MSNESIEDEKSVPALCVVCNDDGSRIGVGRPDGFIIYTASIVNSSVSAPSLSGSPPLPKYQLTKHIEYLEENSGVGLLAFGLTETVAVVGGGPTPMGSDCRSIHIFNGTEHVGVLFTVLPGSRISRLAMSRDFVFVMALEKFECNINNINNENNNNDDGNKTTTSSISSSTNAKYKSVFKTYSIKGPWIFSQKTYLGYDEGLNNIDNTISLSSRSPPPLAIHLPSCRVAFPGKESGSFCLASFEDKRKLEILFTISACKHPLSGLVFGGSRGEWCVTYSEQGTLIRVWDAVTPNNTPLKVLRTGTTPARISHIGICSNIPYLFALIGDQVQIFFIGKEAEKKRSDAAASIRNPVTNQMNLIGDHCACRSLTLPARFVENTHKTTVQYHHQLQKQKRKLEEEQKLKQQQQQQQGAASLMSNFVWSTGATVISAAASWLPSFSSLSTTSVSSITLLPSTPLLLTAFWEDARRIHQLKKYIMHWSPRDYRIYHDLNNNNDNNINNSNSNSNNNNSSSNITESVWFVNSRGDLARILFEPLEGTIEECPLVHLYIPDE